MTLIATITATQNNKLTIIGAFNKVNSENYQLGETPTIISKF